MFATSRKLNVNGRINSLTVSIKTNIGPKTIGLPPGTRVDKNSPGLITAFLIKGAENMKIPTEKTKAIAGVNPDPRGEIPAKLA